MDKEQALEILKALADGVAPYTAEVLAQDSPYQHPQTIRALFLAIAALEKQKPKRELPSNVGKAWNEQEDAELGNSFDTGLSIQELAQKHQRTTGAIKSRLIRLGKLTPLGQPIK
jgi:hypothetical protein